MSSSHWEDMRLVGEQTEQASSQLPRQRQAASPPWPSGTLGKVLTSLAAREKAVRTVAPGTWGGNNVRQSWHTEAGSFSLPGPGRHPEKASHTVMWPTAGRAAGQSHLDTALHQAGVSGKAALLPVPVGFPEVPRPAI